MALRSVVVPQSRVRRPRAKGAPGQHADALVRAQGQHLALLLAVEEVVVVLHGDEAGPTVQPGGVLGLGELPGVHRTRPDVTDLAGLDDVVQGLHRLLDRGMRVEAVDLVEVDVVGAEPGEALVELAEDGLAGQSAAVGPGAHPAVHLRREHDLVTAGEVAQGPADDLLAGAVGVDVRRVEEVDPRLDRLPDQRARGLLVEGPLVPAPVRQAVGHAPQTDPRHVQARRTELHVLHRCCSCLREVFQTERTCSRALEDVPGPQ
ncbi:hypothetical protein SVIOM74S_09899 [Streptomyces violarus]